IGTGPLHGVISDFVPATGTYTYTPNANYFGEDSFTFTLTDAEGYVSPVVTVSIVVNNVNDTPVLELPEAATIGPQSQLLANIAVGGRTISSIAADGEWLAVAYKPDHVVEIYRLDSGQYELE